MNDQTPPEPFTQQEAQLHRDAAAKGKIPSLETLRRYIATIRLSITSSPKKVEKTKTTRNKKPAPDEDSFNAF